MAGIDLSNVPTDDLHALMSGDLSKVSTPTLHYINGDAQGPIPHLGPNTGLAGPAGSVIDTALGLPDVVASAASHAASGALDPLVGLGARISALFHGRDPDAEATAAHQWLAQHGTYHAVTPAGKAISGATQGALQDVTAPFNAAGNALESGVTDATGIPRAKLESGASLVNDVTGSLPFAGGAVRAGMHMAENVANPANIAKTGAEVAEAAGYKGLQSQQDLRLPGPQAITDKLISDDAGVPNGQLLNVPAVQNARTIGPAKVYDAAKASLPQTLTADAGPGSLTESLANIGDTTSQLPRSPDVDALKQAMLNQPSMTRDELFANIQQARDKGTKLLAGDQTDQHALGSAYLQLANAYEDFAGRQLTASGSPVSLDQFQNARTQFAKNYAAEAALKGGEHVDPLAYARIAAKEPDLLTGNSQIVGQVANSLPAAPPFGAERGLVHAVGTVSAGVGTGALAHMAGAGPAAEIAAGASASMAAPYVARAMHNLFSRGNPIKAAATADNPALSYFFPDGREPAPGFNRFAPSPPMPRAPLRLPAPSSVNAGGGATTPSILDELGLSEDVQRAGAAHPGAATRADEPYVAPPQGPGEVHPPLVQNWHGVGPDGVPNFSTAPGSGSLPGSNTRDFAAALSSLVPDNILQRSAPGAASTPVQSGLLPLEDALKGIKAPDGKVKKGAASNAPPRDKNGNSSILDLLGL